MISYQIMKPNPVPILLQKAETMKKQPRRDLKSIVGQSVNLAHQKYYSQSTQQSKKQISVFQGEKSPQTHMNTQIYNIKTQNIPDFRLRPQRTITIARHQNSIQQNNNSNLISNTAATTRVLKNSFFAETDLKQIVKKQVQCNEKPQILMNTCREQIVNSNNLNRIPVSSRKRGISVDQPYHMKQSRIQKNSQNGSKGFQAEENKVFRNRSQILQQQFLSLQKKKVQNSANFMSIQQEKQDLKEKQNQSYNERSQDIKVPNIDSRDSKRIQNKGRSQSYQISRYNNNKNRTVNMKVNVNANIEQLQPKEKIKIKDFGSLRDQLRLNQKESILQEEEKKQRSEVEQIQENRPYKIIYQKYQKEKFVENRQKKIQKLVLNRVNRFEDYERKFSL